MSRRQKTVLITPTWAGDFEHFRLMRASLEHSGLNHLPHYVVVQHEDLELFREFANTPGLHLLSTRDVLPPEVEAIRVRARNLSSRFGRGLTKIFGSLKRLISWPIWPSYTGWHTQQLCKLKLASELDCDLAVIIDSDVYVTPGAQVDDFVSTSGSVCFADWKSRTDLKGKVANWVAVSEAMAGAVNADRKVNVYFDTPFVFDQRLLRAALNFLERGSRKRWWQVLLDQPPRRWSEFGYYKAFLACQCDASEVEWRNPVSSRYIFDTSDPEKVIHTVTSMRGDPSVHYITIHSQASGRESWAPSAYIDPLIRQLQAG